MRQPSVVRWAAGPAVRILSVQDRLKDAPFYHCADLQCVGEDGRDHAAFKARFLSPVWRIMLNGCLIQAGLWVVSLFPAVGKTEDPPSDKGKQVLFKTEAGTIQETLFEELGSDVESVASRELGLWDGTGTWPTLQCCLQRLSCCFKGFGTFAARTATSIGDPMM